MECLVADDEKPTCSYAIFARSVLWSWWTDMPQSLHNNWWIIIHPTHW